MLNPPGTHPGHHSLPRTQETGWLAPARWAARPWGDPMTPRKKQFRSVVVRVWLV